MGSLTGFESTSHLSPATASRASYPPDHTSITSTFTSITSHTSITSITVHIGAPYQPMGLLVTLILRMNCSLILILLYFGSKAASGFFKFLNSGSVEVLSLD